MLWHVTDVKLIAHLVPSKKIKKDHRTERNVLEDDMQVGCYSVNENVSLTEHKPFSLKTVCSDTNKY